MRVSVAAMLFVVTCILLPSHAIAEDSVRSVTVSGQATVSAVPDAAEITAGVVNSEATAALALTANSQQMSQIFEGLKALGVSEREMRTSGFSVSPVYERKSRDAGQPPRITGYRVNNSVHIRLRATDDVGRVLDRLVDLGANSINGVHFVISDRYEKMQKALAEAVRNARHRAELIAVASGARLGQVIEVREGAAKTPRPVFALQARAESADVPIAAGEETLHVSVQATFALE